MPSQEEQWVRMAQPEKWTLKPNSAFILSESLEVLQLMKNIMPSISTSTLTKDWSKMHLFSVDIIGKSHPRKAIVIESHCVEILKYIGKYIYKYLAIIALLFNENLERLWKGHCFDFTKKVSFGKFCVHTLVGLTQEITRFVSCGWAYWEGARSVPFRYKNKMGKRLFEPKGQIWRLSSFLPSLLKTLKTFKSCWGLFHPQLGMGLDSDNVTMTGEDQGNEKLHPGRLSATPGLMLLREPEPLLC